MGKKYSNQASTGFGNLQYMSIAGGSLDFALLVSNVEHVKFILDAGEENSPYFTFLIGMLCTSIILQLLLVIPMFMVNSNEITHRAKPNSKSNRSETWQKITIMVVSLIAIINVFIAVFGNRSQSVIVKRVNALNALKLKSS